MINDIIERALIEDIGEGDHSSLACVPEKATGKATLYIKDDGIIAGIDLAHKIFKKYDPSIIRSQHSYVSTIYTFISAFDWVSFVDLQAKKCVCHFPSGIHHRISGDGLRFTRGAFEPCFLLRTLGG